MSMTKLHRTAQEYSLEDVNTVMEIVFRYVQEEEQFDRFYSTQYRASMLYGQMLTELEGVLAVAESELEPE